MTQASSLRSGMCILHEGDVCRVMTVTHRTPGNLRAFVQVRMRNLKTGNSFDHRFSSTEGVERAILDTVPMEYLYSDGEGHHFMNQQNYEQIVLSDDVLGDSLLYMLPNAVLKIDFYEEKPVGLELPQTVVLQVVETEPGMKGATASSSYKPAKMETGLVVQIPPFVEAGAKIEIDTRETKYLRRV
ncbi:MAG: elongation factor P [Thermoanaerobaculia bacterium]|nr:MAG: elongation factor P [Thermoanaerobaculia bacterium]MBZ0101345.1 elongation factor P [Thermoanaerobaculia bacterium]